MESQNSQNVLDPFMTPLPPSFIIMYATVRIMPHFGTISPSHMVKAADGMMIVLVVHIFVLMIYTYYDRKFIL